MLEKIDRMFQNWQARLRQKNAVATLPPLPVSDRERRKALVNRLKAQGWTPEGGGSPVIVSLQEFFVGNKDSGSIGCNLTPLLEPDVFFSVLRAVRDRPEVQDVVVEISDYDEIDENAWPFSETIYVLARAEKQELESWLATLQYDEVAEVDDEWKRKYPGWEVPQSPLEEGMKIYWVWWD